MPPPSPLKIKTSSVTRLIKEEQSYHKELASQKARLQRMEDNNEDEYEIKQQKKVVVDTEQMIPAVQQKLEQAVEALELQLELIEEETDEKKAAVLAIEEAKKIYEGQPSSVGNSLFTEAA
ncbi:hypothetical protein TWF569_005906 [Orbilia oligospora]|uniref:Tubulin-specific chaperone A n=1 Tax=Orbilia oligospora TaxID=2813651 RepID=A0A7C8K190_ORBOL|nr:hypothetical protein TWF102_008007 [Orbilia oligospora]KAF3103342.1 hypothetical protein TWF706_004949 [Orbilia oligospora]KAF3108822.1 hypothetical protein TWF103_005415 [Orbilia oligospora]KAF3119563.1 hypothetical protein TWF703_003273 [Orbilia oligospora]KAF3129470.1 hypothetical protein TWF594_010936 [Orbilia oligospora]